MRKLYSGIRVICLTALGGGISLLGFLPAQSAITQRDREPVVISADWFPAFQGVAVDRIVLYISAGSSGPWQEIISQVDERFAENLAGHHSKGCRPVGIDPCERTYVLSGTEGSPGVGLDDDDEVVFMARDASSANVCRNVWVGQAGTDTMSTRYRITVHDPVSGESGVVYAYAHLSAHQQAAGDYVSWTQTPSDSRCVNPGTGDPACGWLRSTDETTIPRFNILHTGNWSTDVLCVKPLANDGNCDATDRNMIDKGKLRAVPFVGQEKSELDCDQNVCRALPRSRVGGVRLRHPRPHVDPIGRGCQGMSVWGARLRSLRDEVPFRRGRSLCEAP